MKISTTTLTKISLPCSIKITPISKNMLCLTREKYKELGPFICIDCSRQNDDAKISNVDLRVEIKAANNFPPNTAAYCLVIHDRVIQYNPFSGEVRKI